MRVIWGCGACLGMGIVYRSVLGNAEAGRRKQRPDSGSWVLSEAAMRFVGVMLGSIDQRGYGSHMQDIGQRAPLLRKGIRRI